MALAKRYCDDYNNQVISPVKNRESKGLSSKKNSDSEESDDEEKNDEESTIILEKVNLDIDQVEVKLGDLQDDAFLSISSKA